ncbi:MAG: GNAT family N-acetyltransferase [Candidatus Bathyarchaeota archaeon]|nr:GNAT family N-acetyltransferase [Candidatus Bathyarchaeota archaeon]
MVSEMQVLVREMLPGKKDDVEGLFGRSLGLVDRIVFLLSFEDALKSSQRQSGGSLVAVHDGRVVGSVSMRFQPIRGRRTGFIDALVTDRELRGRGIGRSLVEGAISWLEERGCEVIYATADRYNSPSWNLFVHRGFSVYELPQQVGDHGLGFLRLWLAEFHFLGYGTFFLRRGREGDRPRENSEAWHFTAAWLGVSLAWLTQALRTGRPPVLFPLLFAVAGLSLLAHELPQKLVGHRLGLETNFKAWGSGILFSSLLAAVGSFFPVYGSTYVKQLDWWYEPRKKGMGVFFAVGPSVSLTLAFAFWALSHFATGGLFAASGRVGYTMNLVIVIFNLIPVQAAGGLVWDGKKILTWNKAVWLMLFAGTAALVVLDMLF